MKAGMIGFWLLAPLAACGSDVEAYNAANTAGNLAARDGRFESAIAHWEQAAALDPEQGPCKGEFQRNQIQAAKDTAEQLAQGKLPKIEAVAWFDEHSTALWMPNACNSN